jgi:hypothetical protein
MPEKTKKPQDEIRQPVVVGPEYLVPLIHRTVATIKVDARRRPESLPPRLKIPGSSKLLWLESDVMEWLQSCRTAKPPVEKFTLYRGRKR